MSARRMRHQADFPDLAAAVKKPSPDCCNA
jgi:hypothetical protein